MTKLCKTTICLFVVVQFPTGVPCTDSMPQWYGATDAKQLHVEDLNATSPALLKTSWHGTLLICTVIQSFHVKGSALWLYFCFDLCEKH